MTRAFLDDIESTTRDYAAQYAGLQGAMHGSGAVHYRHLRRHSIGY